jgi:hypothetical protein
MRSLTLLAAAGASLALSPAASAAGNLIPANVASVTLNGTFGVLRPGSGWALEPLASATSIADNAFEPENQIWNQNSLWWDEDSAVNSTKPSIEILLTSAITFDSFAVQADDNDTYLLEYWDGSSWLSAWEIGALWDYGLMKRESGPLAAPITTDRLRLSAVWGDGTYAISEVQGFLGAVPEPKTWAMMLAGFGVVGLFMRRSAKRTMNVSFS